MKELEKPIHKVIDQLQVLIGTQPQVDNPVKHLFTPKMYIRQIFMPGGTVAVSKVHNSCHPFVVTQGKYAVCNAETNEVGIIEAPYIGVTTPGSRRVFEIIEDTILTTFHPIDFITGEENRLSDEEKEAIALKVEELIIDKREIILEDLV